MAVEIKSKHVKLLDEFKKRENLFKIPVSFKKEAKTSPDVVDPTELIVSVKTQVREFQIIFILDDDVKTQKNKIQNAFFSEFKGPIIFGTTTPKSKEDLDLLFLKESLLRPRLNINKIHFKDQEDFLRNGVDLIRLYANTCQDTYWRKAEIHKELSYTSIGLLKVILFSTGVDEKSVESIMVKLKQMSPPILNIYQFVEIFIKNPDSLTFINSAILTSIINHLGIYSKPELDKPLIPEKMNQLNHIDDFFQSSTDNPGDVQIKQEETYEKDSNSSNTQSSSFPGSSSNPKKKRKIIDEGLPLN